MALLLVAAPTGQADSTGAYHIDFDNCFGEEGLYSYCSAGTTVGNFASTPAGNMAVTYHSRFDYSFWGFGCQGEGENNENLSYLLKPDSTGAYHFSVKRPSTLNCSGADVATCEELWVFTIANNELRVARHTVDCES